jgi:hypothetical protein
MSSSSGATRHACSVKENGYCDCQNVPLVVLRRAQEVLPELACLVLWQVKKNLIPSDLVCRECGHLGMLVDDIFNEAPGVPGYACNNEADFAICPRCCHWTVISNPMRTPRGARV